MNKQPHPALRGFYIFLAITLGIVIISVPVIYLQSQQAKKVEELKQLQAAQANIQKLILEQKKQELTNIIDKQLEEMKQEQKQYKEASTP